MANVEIPALAKKYENYVLECRKKLHRMAELGGNEVKTSAFIASEAKKLKLPVEKVSRTGLIVTLDTGREGNGVALRADIDALPIDENKNNLKRPRTIVSDNPHTCHACGHDCHMAMLLGAMKVLCDMRGSLTGRVYFCFEEGEEISSGWDGMLEALEQKSVNTVFGLHVSSALEHGYVNIEAGPRMGGTVGVEATFVGRGGHGSRPDLSVNPIFAAASAVTALPTAIVNQVDVNETVTLGITSVQGGKTNNIIPDTARVLGTMRFFNIDAGKSALKIEREVFSSCARMNRCTVEFGPSNNLLLSPTVNDADAVKLALGAIAPLLPEGSLVHEEKWYGSESFSQYLVRYKGAFGFLGVRNEQTGCFAEHHSEYFDVDDSGLINGVICHAAYAAEAVKNSEVASWGFTPAEDFMLDGDEDAAEVPPAEAAPAAFSSAKYNLDSKIGVLLKSKEAKKAVDSVVKGIVDHPQIGFAKGMTVRKAAKLLPSVFTEEVLSKVEEALAGVKD